MSGITIELDDRQLQAWCEQTTKAMNAALRSAVDKSARYARSKTIKVIAADARVPLARMRNAMPLVVGAKSGAGDITATWTVNNGANSIRDASGAVAYTRGTPISASTFALSGGGSAGLLLPHGFVLRANGGAVIVTRNGKGKSAFKVVYAEGAASAMKQANSVPRKVWQAAAETSVALLVVAAVSAAMQGSTDVATPVKLMDEAP